MTEYEQNDVQDVDRPGLSQELEIKDAEEADAVGGCSIPSSRAIPRPGARSEAYEVPTIVSLGTLAELTHSGSTTPKNDGIHTGHSGA
jgi:hypothetical protein